MDYDLLYMCGESLSNYQRYRKYIKPHLVQKETLILLDEMGEFYKTYTKTNVDWEPFGSYVIAKTAKRLSDHSITTLRVVIDRMKGYKPSIVYDEVIKSLIELDYVARIMEECDQVQKGASDLETVHELATNALKDVERYIDSEELFVVPDISLVADRISSTGYEWRLECLNRSLGPLRDGNFVIVAARVEVGKTTFLASEVSYLATQLPKDRPVVWINNEEESNTVFFRIVQAALGKTTPEIMADQKKAMEDYEKLLGTKDKIKVNDKDVNNVTVLTKLFKELNPGLIVFDQLDKVSGFKDQEREDLRLGQLYKWARNLAKEYGPVITASQLTGDVENMKDPPYIGMESLRGSKTDKPGEADAVITIGKYKEPANEDEETIRTINIPKNKLPGGGTKQVESERHGRYAVRIDATRARYE